MKRGELFQRQVIFKRENNLTIFNTDRNNFNSVKGIYSEMERMYTKGKDLELKFSPVSNLAKGRGVTFLIHMFPNQPKHNQNMYYPSRAI